MEKAFVVMNVKFLTKEFKIMSRLCFAIVETVSKKVIGLYYAVDSQPMRLNAISTRVIRNGKATTTMTYLSTLQNDVEQAKKIIETESQECLPLSWGVMTENNELIIEK